ncbi:1-acyl-sn-glycerol-3-phosphate acyltransferase [Geitlerinema sp. P-1104]|nr:1-acyl-sn-glycerol-3-phosphate acyltransferase [Geitlerinema sp. P-1104]
MSSPVRSTSVSSKVSPWLTAILYPLARYLVLPLYFRHIEIQGQQNLPQSGAIILAPTHRSRWDPILVAHSAGYPVSGKHPHFMTSANETEGLQGLLVRRLGAFPVDLGRAGIGSLRHGLELLLKQQMLVIFPEGNVFFIKRNREQSHPDPEQVYPIKPGLGRLAIQAARSDRPSNPTNGASGLHIIPISLRYSSGTPRFRCDVSIEIGQAIGVQPYLNEGSSKQAAKSLMAHVKSALAELHQPLSQ